MRREFEALVNLTDAQDRRESHTPAVRRSDGVVNQKYKDGRITEFNECDFTTHWFKDWLLPDRKQRATTGHAE